MGLKTPDKDMIRATNFTLKQIIPKQRPLHRAYYQGIVYYVVDHACPAGDPPSRRGQEAGPHPPVALLLKFRAARVRSVRYHDVTPARRSPGTRFTAVTRAHKRGGERAVRDLLDVLEYVVATPERDMSDNMRRERLSIYCDANDAFRGLLLGQYGRLPLGWPPDWVYESAFGCEYRKALASRTEGTPLATLCDMDMDAELEALRGHIKREPSDEEFSCT
jgi:pyruvate carboxylase